METNVIYCGDNLEILPKDIRKNSVDLIYIDPPFNTSRQYEVFWGEAQERRAFDDRFGDAITYLDWMRPRLLELYRVLKPTGSFYYHCDWHASHYVKVELDRIFGFEEDLSSVSIPPELPVLPTDFFGDKGRLQSFASRVHCCGDARGPATDDCHFLAERFWVIA